MKCLGPNCPYGYGHHDEHVAAAKLGWERRRQGAAKYHDRAWQGTEAHYHSDHRGRKHFVLKDATTGQHVEVGYKLYESFIRNERDADRAKVQQQQLAKKEFDHAERESARIAASRAKNSKAEARVMARLEKEWAKAEAALQKRQAASQARTERETEKQIRAEKRFKRDILYEALRAVAPIAPYKDGSLNEDHYSTVPRQFRTREPGANTFDQAADEIREQFGLVRDDEDLARQLRALRLDHVNEKARRKTRPKVA